MTKPSLISASPGAHPRRVLGAVALAHSVTHMQSAFLPMIYPFVMSHFGLTYGDLGLMSGIGNALGNATQGVHGFTVRRFYRRTILAVGNILLGVAVVLSALAGSFPLFFAANVLGQIARSPQHPVGASLVAASFGTRLRGTALALDFAGGNLGTVLVPLVGALAIAAFGWRGSLAGFALLPVLAGLSCFMLIPRGAKAPPGAGSGRRGLRWARELLEPLTDRNMLVLALAGAAGAGGRGIGVMMVYFPLYLHQELRLEGLAYGGLYTIMLAGSVVGPIVMGYVSDRVHRKGTLIAAFVLSALAVAALGPAGGHVGVLVVVTAAVGLVVYAPASLLRTLVADVAREGGREMAFGIFFVITYVGGAVWAIVLGYWIDAFGFTSAFILMACSYLAAATVLVPMRQTAVRA
ncbi:MAG: MFS transporter [Thermoleophilia bacterium]